MEISRINMPDTFITSSAPRIPFIKALVCPLAGVVEDRSVCPLAGVVEDQSVCPLAGVVEEFL
jgi:hypothetical protein